MEHGERIGVLTKPVRRPSLPLHQLEPGAHLLDGGGHDRVRPVGVVLPHHLGVDGVGFAPRPRACERREWAGVATTTQEVSVGDRYTIENQFNIGADYSVERVTLHLSTPEGSKINEAFR